MKRPSLVPTRFEMMFLGIFHRIIKSVAYNIFMLLLGFSIGFGWITYLVHRDAERNDNYQCVAQLENVAKQLEITNEEYMQKCNELNEIVKHLKYKLSHDTDCYI